MRMTLFVVSVIICGNIAHGGPAQLKAPEAVPSTLRCTGDESVAEVRWSPVMDEPDGPGTFQLAFVHAPKKVEAADTVMSFTPMFDPQSDPIRYDSGYATEDFRTSLRFFQKKKILMADYDSRQVSAVELLCVNNLPILGAEITFPSAHWDTLSTDLALLEGLRWKKRDAVVSGDSATLPIRFGSNAELTKVETLLRSLKNVSQVRLIRVDGSAVASTLKAKP